MDNSSKKVTCVIEEKMATVTINNPPVNALSYEVMEQLEGILDELAERADLGAVIITGAGQRAFVAGADISQFPDMDQEDGVAFARRGLRIFGKVEALEVPVICAVNGVALGGGLELALACDIRVVASGAKLGQPEVNLGIIPGYGGTQRLPRLVSPGKAKELIFTGEPISAEEAFRIGLADKLVDGDCVAEAQSLAQKILQKGPLAIKRAKKVINEGLQKPLPEGLALEAQNFGELFDTEDQKEGAKAFLEKRRPEYKGN